MKSMEYYILTTRNCNMKCRYCIYGSAPTDNVNTEPNAERVAEYIFRDTSASGKRPTIVFYGGEPLLAQDTIKEILRRTKPLSPDYYMYTNGLGLNDVDSCLVDSIGHILVSCDGERDVHDRFRQAGSYDRVIDNVANFRGVFGGKLIGRITLTSQSNVFDAVLNNLELFDGVFWQHVSSEELESPDDIIKYSEGVHSLVQHWLKALESGRILNILPIQAIVKNVLTGDTEYNFRCGVGTSLRVIDVNGDVYLCDELMKHNRGHIGNIVSDVHIPENILSWDDTDCKRCDVSRYCGGRCLYSHIQHSKERVAQYCTKTRMLVKEVVSAERMITGAIEKYKYKIEDVVPNVAKACIEEIP